VGAFKAVVEVFKGMPGGISEKRMSTLKMLAEDLSISVREFSTIVGDRCAHAFDAPVSHVLSCVCSGLEGRVGLV
jgi:hypothetical protein